MTSILEPCRAERASELGAKRLYSCKNSSAFLLDLLSFASVQYGSIFLLQKDLSFGRLSDVDVLFLFVESIYY